MSYLGPDQEDCVNVTRYVFPEQALPAIGQFLSDLEHRWMEESSTHVVEIGPLPLPPTDEQWEREMADDTEIM